MTTLAVLQPGYLPWLGFFNQMQRADIFVYYDDVQFDKHGWRNRNRLKSVSGPQWLTVPVLHKGLGWPAINEVEIDNRTPWGRKHLTTIRQLYSRAPYLQRYLPELEDLLNRHWDLLVDVDLSVTDQLARWLGIETRTHRSSDLGISGEQSERLLRLCQHFGATRYLSGNAAQAYLDVELFSKHGIEVEWQDYEHPVYRQMHGPFIPYLSALDLLLNCGEDSQAILRQRIEREKD